MKKDLLTTLNCFCFTKLQVNIKRQSNFASFYQLRYFLILLVFCDALQAQTRVHPFPANGSLILPAGIDEVIVEGWGAGGAGGAASTGFLVGRSGGGGGGGAYAKATITTSTPQTLQVNVGGLTAGGGGNGAAGNPSYITGFNSSFYATGGLGGNAYIADGANPSGGLGGGQAGTTAVVGGQAALAGQNGGNGAISVAGLLLTSGAGGTAGNPGIGLGGTGGLSRSAAVLGTAPGNPGNNYGGGGGGAISAAGVQNGGDGARGHMILTYTCKTYSLTGISAANVCIPNGTTSLVKLTGSLPKGTYTVTYSTSIPVQNNQTTTMTVNNAGTGEFTAMGLNTPGNSTITVVSLASQDCSSTLNGNNQIPIVVGTTPTITLGSIAAKCASTSIQSTALNYNATTNSPTLYSITWNASPSNNFLPVTNAALPASPINIAIPANTLPGTYTGTLNVINAAGCVSSGYNFNVVINPNPTIGTSGTVAAVCQSTLAQTTSLAYTATTNTPISYSIAWTGLTSQGTTTFAFTAGTGSINNIAVPANASAGTYNGVMTILNANGCSATQNVSLTINPRPTIATSGTITPVCQSASAQTTSLGYTATTNSPISYSIAWTGLASQVSTNFAFTAGTGTINNIIVPANTAVGTYNGVMTILTANGCSAAQNVSLTINSNPTIATSGTITPVCQSASVQTTSLAYTATTNSPISYSIAWTGLASQGTTTFAFAAGTGSINNITVPANASAGTYNGVMTILNANGCSATQNVSLTINPRPTIATSGTITPVCHSVSAQTTSLGYTATTNSPISYSIAWTGLASQVSTNFAFTAGTGTINNIIVPANTAVGTYNGVMTILTANGCSATQNVSLTINSNPTIATSGTITPVCQSVLAQTTSLGYTATTNSPISYSIAWTGLASQVSTNFAFTAGTGTINNIIVPANTAVGTYNGVMTILTANGCSATQNVSLTINSNPTIATSGTITPVCQSVLAQTTSLGYTATTNSPISYSIAWTGLANQVSTNFAFTAGTGTINNIIVPANASAGTYNGVMTIMNANGCSATQNVSLTINSNPTIATSGTITPVCQNASAQTTSLGYTATTNSPISYSIAWTGLASQVSTNFAFTAGTGTINNIIVPANTAVGTYNGVMTILTANGCAAIQNVSLIINSRPTIATSGTITSVCQNASAQTTSLAYTATTNSPISYSIAWTGLASQGTTTFAFAAGTGSINNIAVPANASAGTYNGVMTILTANGCSATQNVSLTINSNPTITTAGTVVAVCESTFVQTTSLAYSATTGSPLSYSIDWDVLADQGATAFTFSSGSGSVNNITVPANTTAGTYTGLMTIFTSANCFATHSVSLTVNANPTIATTGVFSAVCQSASAQSTTLNYNSTTGSPVNYAIDWIALTDQAATPFPFSSGSGTIINVSVPANTPAGTYNGVMTISTANGCPVNQAVSLIVNEVSPTPTVTVTQQPSCQDNSGSITITSPAAGAGYSYTIDGIDFTNTTGVFTGIAPGVYNVKVRNTVSGCESLATPITINTFSTKTWNGSDDANWGNPANWTPTGVPLASDCVDIPDVTINPIISGTNGSFFANRLTIENEGSLIVEGTNTITVTNEVKVLGNGIFMFENNSSLVQVSNAVNVGNIIYKRNTQPMRRFDLTHWSTPVKRVPAFTLYDLTPATLYDKFYKFDPVAQWVTIFRGVEEMEPGRGYSVRAPQPYSTTMPQIYNAQFIGVPNNGNFFGPEAVAEKYNLLGNPYPSAIYADQFIYDNQANIYGTIYIWTHNTLPQQSVPGEHYLYYSNDDYAIYNLSGSVVIGSMVGDSAPNPGNQSVPKGYIAAGQGFLVKSRASQKSIFTNSMRVAGENSQFYKSGNLTAIERHRVWLNMSNTQGAFKQLLIGYATGATNSWDNNFDGVSLDGHPFIDFYSVNEGKKLVIQGRALPFTVSDTIQLGYRSALQGEFTIAIDHADGDLTNQVIYLKDNVTNKIHNLTTGGYTFTTAIGVFQKRFVLRYTDPNDTLGNEEFTNSEGSIFVSVKDKNIKLQSFSDNENLEEVSVYDSGGKMLYNKKAIDSKEWLITNLRSGPQVLLVKIKLDNGQTVTKKIIYN